MPANVIIGAQWGDEGKGKIVDVFTEEADVVVRFQGGNNAGHTLVVDSGDGPKKTVLHLIPSGILYPEKICLVASGVVVDADVLFHEIERLAENGRRVTPEQLRISRDAHVIMPYHKALDKGRELKRGGDAIGTTGRGIGPAYEDKASRNGVRMRDLVDRSRLEAVLDHVLPEKNALMQWMGLPTFDRAQLIEESLALGARLEPHFVDCRTLIHSSLSQSKRVLFEGAQGTLLDVGHGTYPFVTSSHTITGGVCTGAGIPPMALGAAVGVAKAYATRVGSGPFPTELHDQTGEWLRARGNEFGSTTGRPRRCGWFDAVLMRTAQQLNGFTGLAITKLDVLTGLPEVKICVGYRVGNDLMTIADSDARLLEAAEPVYETLPGWDEELANARKLSDLPANARRFLDRIVELVETPLDLVSVGPGRHESIVLKAPFR